MHDETVHPLIAELVGKKQLPFGVARGVHEKSVMITGQQRAAYTDTEQLLPQILQRTEQQPHRAGPAAGQGARDAVDVIAKLGSGDAHPLLCFLRRLDTPQGVGDSSRRQPRHLCHLADCRALGSLGHRFPT